METLPSLDFIYHISMWSVNTDYKNEALFSEFLNK